MPSPEWTKKRICHVYYVFDDRGNRMSPTWARKGPKRWRYYVSQAALQGDKSKAGSIVRVPAAEVEALVTEAVGKLSADRRASQTDIRDRIDRVAIGGTMIQIRLSEVGDGDDSVKTLMLPWTAPSPYRRREIIQGASWHPPAFPSGDRAFGSFRRPNSGASLTQCVDTGEPAFQWGGRPELSHRSKEALPCPTTRET